MMFRMMIAAALLAAMAPTAMAQAATPEAALAKFVELANAGELTSAAGQAVLTGEAKQMATSAKSALPAPERVVMIGADRAAARFLLKGAPGEEADVYFYLDKTPAGWAVSAYRNKAFTAMDIALLQQMKKQPVLSAADELEKRNLELALSTDGQLRTWFAANRETVERAVRSETGAAELGFKSIREDSGGVHAVVNERISFLKPGASGAPRIDPMAMLWVEEVGGGWFLVRNS